MLQYFTGSAKSTPIKACRLPFFLLVEVLVAELRKLRLETVCSHCSFLVLFPKAGYPVSLSYVSHC